jgi:hypothetical protein
MPESVCASYHKIGAKKPEVAPPDATMTRRERYAYRLLAELVDNEVSASSAQEFTRRELAKQNLLPGFRPVPGSRDSYPEVRGDKQAIVLPAEIFAPVVKHADGSPVLHVLTPGRITERADKRAKVAREIATRRKKQAIKYLHKDDIYD